MRNRLRNRLYILAEWVDCVLDFIPSYEDGQWYRHGCWGCRIRMYNIWGNRYKESNDN